MMVFMVSRVKRSFWKCLIGMEQESLGLRLKIYYEKVKEKMMR